METVGERNGPSRAKIVVWLNDANLPTDAKRNVDRASIVAQVSLKNSLSRRTLQ